MTRTLVIAIVATAATARADGALQEVSAGSSPATSTSPGSSWIADRIAGIWDADRRVQVRFDLAATQASAATATASSHDVILASLSADVSIDSHWSLRASGGYSPETTALTSSSVPATGLFTDAMQATAQLEASSSMATGAVSVTYDTAGTSDRETSAEVSIATSYYQLFQRVTSVSDPSGQMVVAQQLRAYCAAHPCGGELASALYPQWTQLGQIALGANVTETIDQQTDVGLDAAYYLYDQDPTRAGYFTVAADGRSNFGAGIGVAPLQYTLAPAAMHRWGRLMGTVALSYGSYVDGQGYDVTTSVRVQYKLDVDEASRVKLYGKLASSLDVDQQYNARTSGSLALGVQYTW